MAFIGAKPTNVPLTSADLQDSIITSAKIVDGTISSSDIDLTDNYAFTGTVTGAGESNAPSFSVQDNAVQALPNATITKLVWQTEDFDTGSAFASNKFTVPSGQAGKYFFYASWQFAVSTNFNEQRIYIYKNGTAVDPNIQGYHDHYGSIQISKILDLSVSDYIEVYAYHNEGAVSNTLGNNVFQGFKISS